MVKMLVTFEARESCMVQHEDGRITRWKAGERRTWSIKQARQIIHDVAGKVDLLRGRAQAITGKKDIMVIQCNDWIIWHHPHTDNPDGFGSLKSFGEVEGLHIDDQGVSWAFVSLLDGTWSVVNLQYAEQVDIDA
jgi:hypothetical protein